MYPLDFLGLEIRRLERFLLLGVSRGGYGVFFLD